MSNSFANCHFRLVTWCLPWLTRLICRSHFFISSVRFLSILFSLLEKTSCVQHSRGPLVDGGGTLAEMCRINYFVVVLTKGPLLCFKYAFGPYAFMPVTYVCIHILLYYSQTYL